MSKHRRNDRNWIKRKPMSVVQARPMQIVLADTKLGKLMASADPPKEGEK